MLGLVTPISLGVLFGPRIGKYSAADLCDFEFISRLGRAGILANPCNPWEICVSDRDEILPIRAYCIYINSSRHRLMIR